MRVGFLLADPHQERTVGHVNQCAGRLVFGRVRMEPHLGEMLARLWYWFAEENRKVLFNGDHIYEQCE